MAPNFKTSNRGFLQGPEIAGDYGGTLRVYESSGMTPAIWINAKEPCDPNGTPYPTPMETTLLLGLEKAAALRDQLTYLIDHHYSHTLPDEPVDKGDSEEDIPIKWTLHGHEIPGVIYGPNDLHPPKARCGGPMICPNCALDVAVVREGK